MAPDETPSTPPVVFLPTDTGRVRGTASMGVSLSAFLVLLLGIPSVLATSRIYGPIDQLITRSDFIAVVVVDKSNQDSMVKPQVAQGFECASQARVETVIKGDPVESVLIHHMSGRDDALFQQGPGSYLVFLNKHNDVYFPTDGWPSSKNIVNKQVAGWSDIHRFNEDYENLETAIEYIKAKDVQIPVPPTTPFDSDPTANKIYLEDYRTAYRTILANINVECRMSVEGEYRKASDTGWRDGMRAAIKRYPEKLLEIYGFTLEDYRRTTGKEYLGDE